jgi:hypothetical protein
MVFSFPKVVLFFFQGKEVIDLFIILYSEIKRRKKEMRKKKIERDIKKEKRIFSTIFFMVLPLSKFCFPT